ncbi:MAG: alpha/beta fold hydrolase [Gammaproteobacteria bacterium]|nr:alpha/beta fold hydrolase [Gammaproteobacteria bacterium]
MKITLSRPGSSPTHIFIKTVTQAGSSLGEHRPVSFILPGGPGADHMAYLNYTCLQTVSDLVFHDPRGCGQSDKSIVSDYTMENYIDDVEAIRTHLGLKKIIVIGKSYGSMCALGYALKYPQAVDKLILAAGAPSYRFLETAKKNLQRQGSVEQINICKKLWSGSFANADELTKFFQLMHPLYSYKARTGTQAFDANKKILNFSYEVLNVGFKHAFWHFDYENLLQKLFCPTLILAGLHDWINDIRHAEFMVARIPHSQLNVFEKASHAMEVDVPTEFFQAIADFIQR